MAVKEVQNRPSVLPGSKINEGTGPRSETLLSAEPENFEHSLPKDIVQMASKSGISIKPGPTPSHNILQITDSNTGEVKIQIPPNSASALYGFIQNLLMRGA